MAPHEKVLVDTDFLDEDEYHGTIPCHECHGGDPNDANYKTAHKGVVKDPTLKGADKACGDCHEDLVKSSKKSLHVTLNPFKLIVEKRATKNPAILKELAHARKQHCGKCHASCGQCHISRPEAVEGGLMDGHIFQKKPPVKQTCTACHGSRIGKEFFGENKGFKPNVHFSKKYMKCDKCHTGDELHGDGSSCTDRYDVTNGPTCLKCHKDIYNEKSKYEENHTIHKDKASCYVCHAQSYKNCSSCHIMKDSRGVECFKTDKSWMDFKIGLNPKRTKKRPEKFVVVRHVPVCPDTCDYYIEDAFKNFDKVPTWKPTSPHNILRITPQNKTCDSCHGNKSLFLHKKDVVRCERKANAKVVVPENQIPEKIGD